jgi:flavin-dependent dehydrogenase
MRKYFDAAVLGGGPAGIATALALIRLGHSAIVIEASEYETTRIGETLPPAVRTLLANLGLWDRFLAEKHLETFSIRSAWGKPNLYYNDFIFDPYGPGWHVNRARFDAWLASEAEKAGVVVCRRTRMLSSSKTGSGSWQFAIDSGREPAHLKARFIVDATGRASTFACKQGAKRLALDHLVGVVGFLSPSSKTAFADNSTLVESIEEGWWYSALLPGGQVVTAYFTDADLFGRGSKLSANFWLLQLRRTKHTSARLDSFNLDSPPKVVAANTAVLGECTGNNWLAVGDAVCSFDPLSSQGIYKALDSGWGAGKAIHDHLMGTQSALSSYALRMQEQFEGYMRKRKEFYSREMRWPLSPFWKRRHDSGSQNPLPRPARST